MKLIVNKNKCPQNHKCPSIRVCPKGAITQKDIYSLPEASETLIENGFTKINRFMLGENFYCLVFKPTRVD